jgi:hypothetical protein
MKIDGLPINSMVIFHGYVTNNQRVFWQETWFLTQTYPDYVSIFSVVSVEEHYHYVHAF